MGASSQVARVRSEQQNRSVLRAPHREQVGRGCHSSNGELDRAIIAYLDVHNENPGGFHLDELRRPNPRRSGAIVGEPWTRYTNTMTLVSVVIPYFNRLEWLKPAVDSVLLQTFPDFEVIVIDDGSEEHPGILEMVEDARVRYVRQEHLGVSSARNRGIRLARGKYIAFLDADDVFLPEKLEVQVGQMEARPDIAFSHTSYRRMDAAGNDLEDIRSGTFGGTVYPEIVRRCPIATPTVMVLREMLGERDLAFDQSVGIGEDTILWIDIARRYEILGIDCVLTKVRLHGRNAFSDPLAQYRGGMEVLRHAFLKDTGLGVLFRRRALAGVCSSAGQIFLEQGQSKSARRYVSRTLMYWPFDRWALVTALELLLPQRVLAALKRIRDAAHDRGSSEGQ